MNRPASKTPTSVWTIDRTVGKTRSDHLATEEPMEIRLVAQGVKRTVAVTMRTPGNDFELAAGFLYAEGVFTSLDDVSGISYCVDRGIDAAQQYNIVNVTLRNSVVPDFAPLERHFYTTSSCGVCGKASLDALQVRQPPVIGEGPVVLVEVLHGLADTLCAAQGVFQKTGGLHAAALFDTGGRLIQAREDVGRHNALDKLVGWALMAGKVPLSDCILLVSGRSSFEILQKSLAAGIPIVCAISAPSSLAVDLAREYGITLIGFLRGERFNVYTSRERIRLPSDAPAHRA